MQGYWVTVAGYWSTLVITLFNLNSHRPVLDFRNIETVIFLVAFKTEVAHFNVTPDFIKMKQVKVEIIQLIY